MNHQIKKRGPVYEVIDHTADIGIRVWGDSHKALFVHASQGMFDLIVHPQGDDTGTGEQKEVLRVTGNDGVDLFINWLRELLYIWTGRERLVRTVDIASLTATKISAAVTTYPFNPSQHTIRHELKAVTYHQARVDRCQDGWMAEVIFDV